MPRIALCFAVKHPSLELGVGWQRKERVIGSSAKTYLPKVRQKVHGGPKYDFVYIGKLARTHLAVA